MIERSNSDSTSSSSNSNSSNNNNEINAIRPNDVLCGRGGLTNSHIGNKNFRFVVAEYQTEYLNARKKEKKEIAKRIVDRIHQSEGRFLKRTADSEVWSEVTYKKATEKTSQALREGLDVRHKTVRPEKLIHRRESDETNPRKRPRLVEGMVMESPKLMGMLGGHDIPDLKEESGLGSPTSKFEPLFSFFPAATDHTSFSEEECQYVEQI